MQHALTTQNILFAALALALTASTIWTHVYATEQPAYAPVHREASRTSGPGFSGAFGDGTVVRNLLF